MASSLNQIAERCAYGLDQPNNILLKEHIKFSIKAWRATLIRRDIAANGISDEFLQTIKVPLEKIGKIDACETSPECYILRTKYKVPKSIRLKADVNYKFVGIYDEHDNLKPITYVEPEEFRYTKFNSFTSNVIRYTNENQYFKLYNNTLLKSLVIQTAFSDPRELNTSCDEECYNDDMDYPISEDMIFSIIQGLIKGEFLIQNPTDEEVNIVNKNLKLK